MNGLWENPNTKTWKNPKPDKNMIKFSSSDGVATHLYGAAMSSQIQSCHFHSTLFVAVVGTETTARCAIFAPWKWPQRPTAAHVCMRIGLAFLLLYMCCTTGSTTAPCGNIG